MMDWIRGMARQADQGIARRAIQTAKSARKAGIDQNAEWMTRTAASNPQAVADQMGTQGAIPNTPEQRKAAKRTLSDQALRDEYIRRHAPGMNRGPMNIGQMGPLEAANSLIATNKVVRRGVLPVAVAGGGVMAGAAVTAGAQNLMALMGFMNAGKEQQERVEQSPLT
jgi:hypothetical protein